MHKEFKGKNTFDEQINQFGNAMFRDGDTPINSKKRRNALTEVIRFICNQEFTQIIASSSNPTDQLYQKTLKLMLNGNINTAIQELNKCGKPKMGLLLSQSINNPFGKQQLIS
jgi:hypothetical protein